MRTTLRRRATGFVALAALALALTGCARHSGVAVPPISPASVSPGPIPAATGRATIGDLTITGGYIPQPASPDVAAAYLTITNAGAAPETITRVTTSVTSAVMAMTETEGNGVGMMTDLRTVTIPAHGRVAFTPGHAHLMLQNPTTRLRAGMKVNVTITFAHAGTVTLTIPVRPLSGG